MYTFTHTSQKKAIVAILIPDKVDFSIKIISRDKEEIIIMIKRLSVKHIAVLWGRGKDRGMSTMDTVTISKTL